MLRIIIALIVFAIADDACAGRASPTRSHVSKRTLAVMSGHRIVKILRPNRQRKQNID